jgi:hypothetical protein
MNRAIRSVLLLGLLAWVRSVSASALPADTAALEFQGFRAGARLNEIDSLVRSLGGSRFRCDRAKADRHVMECRAVITDPELGGSVRLWVSAMDSVAGVITLSSVVTADRLAAWRESIERRYGRVDAQVQGTQWMMQWVRHGRMLRLTWRIEKGEKTASVSLVDGPVLDAWGRGRGKPQRR